MRIGELILVKGFRAIVHDDHYYTGERKLSRIGFMDPREVGIVLEVERYYSKILVSSGLIGWIHNEEIM